MQSNLKEPLITELPDSDVFGAFRPVDASLCESGLARSSLHSSLEIPMLSSPRRPHSLEMSKSKNRSSFAHRMGQRALSEAQRAHRLLIKKPIRYLVQDGSQGRVLRSGMLLFTAGELLRAYGYIVARYYYRQLHWPFFVQFLAVLLCIVGLVTLTTADLDIDLYLRRNKKTLVFFLFCYLIYLMSLAVYLSYFFCVAMVPFVYLLLRFQEVVDQAGLQLDSDLDVMVTKTLSFSRCWVLTVVAFHFCWAATYFQWALYGSPAAAMEWEVINAGTGEHRGMLVVLAVLRIVGALATEGAFRLGEWAPSVASADSVLDPYVP
jgi:hypothetical protein